MFSGITYGLKEAGIFKPETLFSNRGRGLKEDQKQALMQKNTIQAEYIFNMVKLGAGTADLITGIVLLTISILAMQGYFLHLSPLAAQSLFIGGTVFTAIFLPAGFALLTLGITEAIKCCLPNNRC